MTATTATESGKVTKRQAVLEHITTLCQDYIGRKDVKSHRIQGMNGILVAPVEARTKASVGTDGRLNKEQVEDAKKFFTKYIVTVHIHQAPFFPDRSYRVFNYNPVHKTLQLADGVSVDAKDVYWDLCEDRSIEITPATESDRDTEA